MDMIGYSNVYYGVTIEGTPNAAIQLLMNQTQVCPLARFSV